MTCNKLIIELKETAKTPHVKQTHKKKEIQVRKGASEI